MIPTISLPCASLGVIDLPTMQKKANLHFSLSLDLFGSEVSTNAANYYTSGVKGRFQETRIEDDHRLTNASYPVSKLVDGQIKMVEEPALTAINMRLRDDYVADCAKGVERWNKIIEKSGVTFRLRLPDVAFNRHIGEFQNVKASPDGQVLGEADWAAKKDQWMPSKDDGDFIASLMAPCWERGKFASWISAAQGWRRQQGRRLRVREDPPGLAPAGGHARTPSEGPTPRAAARGAGATRVMSIASIAIAPTHASQDELLRGGQPPAANGAGKCRHAFFAMAHWGWLNWRGKLGRMIGEHAAGLSLKPAGRHVWTMQQPRTPRAGISSRAAAALTAATAVPTGWAIAQAKPLKVGLMLPYSGTFAQLGENITIAVETVHRRTGGKLAGREVADHQTG